MALINWWALSLTLAGYARKNPIQMLTGIAIKPLLLSFLIIYAVKAGIEITSFLAALNTFFVCLFGYMIGKYFRSGRSRNGGGPILTGNNEAHV